MRVQNINHVPIVTKYAKFSGAIPRFNGFQVSSKTSSAPVAASVKKKFQCTPYSVTCS